MSSFKYKDPDTGEWVSVKCLQGPPGEAGGGKLDLIGETEIATEDEVTLIEFDGLENYDEAMMIVFCPWSGDVETAPTAIVQINGNQVEKDWYNFQNKTVSKYNTLRIKRIDDGRYQVLAYANDRSVRFQSSLKICAIYEGTISKIGFSLSVALKTQVYSVATTNCFVRYYAR